MDKVQIPNLASAQPASDEAGPRRDAGGLKDLLVLIQNIAECHARGELHLDAAPECGDAATNKSEITLTVPLLPPELADIHELIVPRSIELSSKRLKELGRDVDPRRIDLYAIGRAACELTAGADTDLYLRSPTVKARIPAKLRSLIDACLGHNPQQRLADANEVVQVLTQVTPELSFTETPAHGTGADAIRDTPVGRGDSGSASAASELPFARLGHYELIARVGSGGMGDVYRARDPALERDVALKVLPTGLSRNAGFVERFTTEARAVAKLAHPNIVPVFFTGAEQGVHFFAMQYVDGPTLADLIAQEGSLAPSIVVDFVRQIVTGLSEAHRHGLIHRDIKPSNVLIDRCRQRAMLADFGLVKSLSDSIGMTATGVVMGTVDYLSPEQGRGKSVDERSDLYSIGVLMYHALSGRLPFMSDSPTAMIFQHAYESPTPLLKAAPSVPIDLASIVDRLLLKDPSDRFQTASELLEALARCGELPSPLQFDRLSAYYHPTDIHDVLEASPGNEESQVARAFARACRGWKARLLGLFNQYAPEYIKRLQSTQLQVDGGLAAYEQRRNRLVELTNEAREIDESLSLQMEAETKAAAEAAEKAQRGTSPDDIAAAQERQDFHQREAARLADQISRQREQVATLEAALNQAGATLERLRSQRDILNARLKAAIARLKIDSARDLQSRRRIRISRLKLATTALGLIGLVLLGIKFSGSSTIRRSAPLGDESSAGRQAVAISTAIQRENGLSGRFHVTCKGEFQLLVNGQAVLSNDDATGYLGASSSVELHPGDVVLVRAKSPFVYRAIRFAFVTDDGNNIWSAKRKHFRVLENADPFSVSQEQITLAEEMPGIGRVSDESQERWDSFALPDTSEWMWAGGKNAWSQFATIVDPELFEPFLLDFDLENWEWTEPQNLGPAINSPTVDGAPWVSVDGLTLLINSMRGGGQGNADIWMAQRASIRDDWGPLKNLGPNINGSSYDGGCSMTADGLTLVFDSYREGGEGNSDIYISHRESKDAPWPKAVNMGPVVNSEHGEWCSHVSADGLEVCFCSARPGGLGYVDLWKTARESAWSPWQRPINLGIWLNSPHAEWDPQPAAGGLAFFLGSDRPGGLGKTDIYVGVRQDKSTPFGPAKRLGETVNSPHDDSPGSLSEDGRTLWFVSDRPGGVGDKDIWVTHRVPKK